MASMRIDLFVLLIHKVGLIDKCIVIFFALSRYVALTLDCVHYLALWLPNLSTSLIEHVPITRSILSILLLRLRAKTGKIALQIIVSIIHHACLFSGKLFVVDVVAVVGVKGGATTHTATSMSSAYACTSSGALFMCGTWFSAGSDNAIWRLILRHSLKPFITSIRKSFTHLSTLVYFLYLLVYFLCLQNSLFMTFITGQNMR